MDVFSEDGIKNSHSCFFKKPVKSVWGKNNSEEKVLCVVKLVKMEMDLIR